ncbi:p28 protein [Tribonema minus]|uniref:p28 protein n=1 Tax=Tribonema minus TaxID=303371 RepID=A0A835YSJ6_9STRA|nr:p28 protein [Tribonema minus]
MEALAQHPNAVPDSLVRYDQPIFGGVEPATGHGGNGTASSSIAQLEDMMNSMLPPREWTEETGTWMQCVSKNPATRLDVVTLQECLDKKLGERQARDTGICPVRDDLYSQAFDELIRQVTLDGPERGLLLLRVRDEIRMTIDAYRTLYDSSVVFGIKKQLQAEQGMDEMEAEIAQLEESKQALEYRAQELRNRVELMEKREAEQRSVEDKRRREEVEFLKYQGQHLDSFLKQIGGSK